MGMLHRLYHRTARVAHGLTRQLPDRPYPSDHPWALRHGRR